MQPHGSKLRAVARKVKVSVGNAPAFGEVVTEPPKKSDGIDASTRQISEVLSSLANDAGGRGGNPRVEPRLESVKAETPTKSVAVSWSKIMEEVGGDTVVSKPLSPDSPGLEDQVVCTPAPTVRELLLEARYTEEEIDETLGPSKDDEARLWKGDEGHEHVHGDGLNENAENGGRLSDTDHEGAADIVGQADGRSENAESRPVVGDEVHEQVHGEGLQENVERLSDNQPSEKAMEKSTVPELGLDTQELMECLFSTAEMKEAACGLPAYGSGPGGEVFVPVSTGDEDHYSCICINFLSEQIEYLDNRSYEDDLLKLPYGGIARITADAMGKYMAYKGLDKGKKVEGFPFVNIKFNWQGAGHTANDCGLYVMVHMLLEEVLSRVTAFKELKDREMEEARDKQRIAGNPSGRKRGVGFAGENSSAKRPCSKVSPTYQTPPSKVALGRTPSSRALSAVNSRSGVRATALVAPNMSAN
ncbi:uncharacterized protein LOC141628216 [Silene latifolia]|uniref:uncharacterized protein LOC141628216 n=1 Tax=Silene latifolia TaxID=37657 RepID=UPI003D78A3C1